MKVIPQISPTLELNPDVTSIDDFCFDDINIVGYDGEYPTFKMGVSV
jgi:thymidylate synthase